MVVDSVQNLMKMFMAFDIQKQSFEADILQNSSDILQKNTCVGVSFQ